MPSWVRFLKPTKRILALLTCIFPQNQNALRLLEFLIHLRCQDLGCFHCVSLMSLHFKLFDRNWTYDIKIKSLSLYQLSYKYNSSRCASTQLYNRLDYKIPHTLCQFQPLSFKMTVYTRPHISQLDISAFVQLLNALIARFEPFSSAFVLHNNTIDSPINKPMLKKIFAGFSQDLFLV